MKFKLFNDELKSALQSATQFVNQPNVDPKSLGLEYIESTSKSVISIGYEERSSASIPVSFKTVTIGNMSDSMEVLEKNLESEQSKVANIICHDISVDAEGTLTVVIMHQ